MNNSSEIAIALWTRSTGLLRRDFHVQLNREERRVNPQSTWRDVLASEYRLYIESRKEDTLVAVVSKYRGKVKHSLSKKVQDVIDEFEGRHCRPYKLMLTVARRKRVHKSRRKNDTSSRLSMPSLLPPLPPLLQYAYSPGSGMIVGHDPIAFCETGDYSVMSPWNQSQASQQTEYETTELDTEDSEMDDDYKPTAMNSRQEVFPEDVKFSSLESTNGSDAQMMEDDKINNIGQVNHADRVERFITQLVRPNHSYQNGGRSVFNIPEPTRNGVPFTITSVIGGSAENDHFTSSNPLPQGLNLARHQDMKRDNIIPTNNSQLERYYQSHLSAAAQHKQLVMEMYQEFEAVNRPASFWETKIKDMPKTVRLLRLGLSINSDNDNGNRPHRN